MKLKKENLIYFTLSVIFLLITIIFFSVNSYLSQVIITKPFSVTIEGLPKNQQDLIKIYGFSPTGKSQELVRNAVIDQWDYPIYSNFKNLYISLPDELIEIKQIKITSGKQEIILTNLKRQNSDTFIDITESLRPYISKTDILLSFFKWKGIMLIFTIIFPILICFLIFLNTAIITKNFSSLFWSLLFVSILGHILFFVFTGCYLITSGIFLYIVLGALLYYAFIIIQKLFNLDFNHKNIKLLVYSLTTTFIIIETIFILTGFLSTSREKDKIYYYESPSISTELGWLHILTNNRSIVSSEFCFNRTVNADGLSDINHPINKKENEYRIIGIGDSFTEGYGADSDSTWLKFLERNMKTSSLKKEITFFNAGVSGSDPIFEKILLEKKLLKYSPDLVMIAINNSDICDIFQRGGKERFTSDGKTRYANPPVWEPIYACLHISRLIFQLLGYNEVFYKDNRLNDLKAFHVIWESIKEIQELSKENKFQLIILIHPSNKEIDKGKLDLAPIIDSLNKHTEISYLNLMYYFINREGVNKENSGNYYWVKDGHHNAKGYELFARGVEWKLKEMGIIDSLKKE